MSSHNIIDVLVVGAGPVGLVLANELARYGLSFRILDKNASRSTWSKALMITSRTMEILENIGLNQEILSTGTVVESGQVNFNHHPLGSVTFELPETTRYPFAFVNPQPECEEAFENVLEKRGGKIERDSEVTGLQIFKDYVQVSTNSGTIKARYVVGCDGAHSLVRHSQQNWKFEGRPVSILWTQCDGTIADERVSSTKVAFAIGKPGFGIRIPFHHQERRFRVITNTPVKQETGEQSGKFVYGRLSDRQPTLEEMNELTKNVMGPAYGEITDPSWLSYFMVQERMVDHLREEKRLFLAGDAAHCHSPAGGQGMNMGIQDAHNLAWKLALVVKGHAADPEKLLESYTAERIPIIRSTIALSSNLVKIMTVAGSPLSWLVRAFISTIIHFKAIQRRITSRMLQVSLRLMPTLNSILSAPTSKMIKPGTMLPDPPHAVFSLINSPASFEGSTHLFPMLSGSSKHIALFFIADHSLHEPHPLFQQFASICSSYSASLRPVILARAVRIGGLCKPSWSSGDDICFLGTRSASTEKTYGLNGKNEMGIIIIRPDGYVAYSTPISANGKNLDTIDKWLATTLVKTKM